MGRAASALIHVPIPLFIILDLVLAIAVLSGIVGLLVWSVASQGRSQHVGSSGQGSNVG